MSHTQNNLLKLCIAAMFAALICVATLVIQIPIPMGYINFGDCFILVGAWILGPVYGGAAAAIGSAMADILTGYLIYAPATFVIKGLIAVIAAILTKTLISHIKKYSNISYIIAAAVGECAMIVGYYLYDAFIMGYGITGAFAGVIGNSVQGAAGIVSGCLMILLITKTGVLKKLSFYKT